jgi:integrase
VLVFVSKTGAPLNYANWRQRVWVPACETAKFKGLRFHDLRSLAASALVGAGVDVKTAQTPSPAFQLAGELRPLRQSDCRGGPLGG